MGLITEAIVLKMQQKVILEETVKFLSSAEGKALLKKTVRNEIKGMLDEGDMDWFLSAPNKKKFYTRIEKAIMGCLK